MGYYGALQAEELIHRVRWQVSPACEEIEVLLEGPMPVIPQQLVKIGASRGRWTYDLT
jgi:hypothetical protein